MKKTLIYGASALMITIAAIMGCKKATSTITDNLSETESIRNNEPVAGELNAFFERNGPQRQVFTFANNNVPLRVVLESGTTIAIPANAFTIGGVRANGATVISIRETRDRADLALSGQSTGSQQLGLLESDGSFGIEATVNGRQVDRALAPGTALDFAVPVRPGVNRFSNLFTGDEVDGGTAGSPFDWTLTQVPNQPVNILPNNGFFRFRWWWWGWINIDIPWNRIPGNPLANNPLTGLTVQLPNNTGPIANFRATNGGNTSVLFVPRGVNAALQITGGTTNTEVSTAPNALPVGIAGRVIGFSVVNGNWWLGVRDITTTSNGVTDLPFEPSTEDQVVAALRSLASF